MTECGLSDTSETYEQRESVFDRVVRSQKEVFTVIPETPRWCDRLDLLKRRVRLADCELYVEEEGRGIPVVLVNGGPGGTHHGFHPWFSRATRFARVIYYDQRGTGLSDYMPGEHGYSIEQAVTDLERLRELLAVERWVVLGHSYGGLLAQIYSTTYPRRVSGLILLGASPGIPMEMMSSRQGDFICDEERARMKEVRDQLIGLTLRNRWPREKLVSLLVYNNFMNGDWKRQHLYKPSPEEMAQHALYGWKHDDTFAEVMSDRLKKIDLTGAFERCPIPTLILEGKWDLTWDTDKPRMMRQNHRNAQMVLFEHAGHNIYSEEPDRFFKVMEDFITNLPAVSDKEISLYTDYLKAWRQGQKDN